MHWLVIVGFALMWVPLILLLLGAAAEREAADSARGSRATDDASLETAFFFKPRPEGREERSRVLEDHRVIRLEDYLRAEHEEAERFVSRPSIGSLYRNCGQGL